MSWWTAELSSHPLLRAVEDAIPHLEAALRESPGSRCMGDDAVELLRSAGVFRMTIPSDLGGLQADPIVQLRVVERLAELDAALGWYANIGSDGGYYAAFLDDRTAKALYCDPDAVTAGFTDPAGRATTTDDGFMVSGRWPFGSASRHSTWLASGCRVSTTDADGAEHGSIVAMLPRSACTIDEDSWQALGLHGSGSFTYSTAGVFVPREHTFDLRKPPRRTDPLYRCPVMYRCNAPGVPLGIGRGALQDFSARLREGTDPATGRPLRESPSAQRVLGHATAMIESARAYAYGTVGELWQRLLAGDEPSAGQRASFRLMLAYTTDICRDAVLELFRASGGGAVYDRHPLQHRLRDMLTAGQHALANERSYPLAGGVLAGLPMTDSLL